MPSFTLADLPRVRTLADLTRLRLEAISFFLVVFLLSAAAVRLIWNSLRRDFPRLPRLSYVRACGAVMLWGLLFLLVLTMISGARELMTPGAWRKDGPTFQLVGDQPPPAEREIAERFAAIERLYETLAAEARNHGGTFPAELRTLERPPQAIPSPDNEGPRFVYVGGKLPGEDEGARILAYESGVVGQDRLVLLTDGMVVWMPASEIERHLKARESL
jgi:hypothetical protein